MGWITVKTILAASDDGLLVSGISDGMDVRAASFNNPTQKER